MFHASFAPLIEKVRDRLPKVKRWYVVADDVPSPAWATPYDDAVGDGADQTVAPWGRSGDDLLLLYTGGTTGMPKGVMWRHDDFFIALVGGGDPFAGSSPAPIRSSSRRAYVAPGMSMLPACPLMHGTGQFSTFIACRAAGAIVLLEP